MSKPKRACYCISLRRAANAVSAAYEVHLAPLGITVNQYSILQGIQRIAPCSVSDLAEHLGLDRTSLVRMLKPLTTQGLILDQARRGQRSRQLLLSSAGQRVIREGLPLWREAQLELEQRIGRAETEHLMSLLARLEDISDTLPPTEA